MRRARIVHLTNTMHLDGTGLTNSTTDLMLAQARSGHSVAMLCRTADEPMRKLLDTHGVELVEGVDASSPMALVRSARVFSRRVREGDVLHVHTVRTTLFALLAAPIRFWTRSISTLHNPYQRSVIAMYLTARIVSISAVDQRYVRRRSLGLRCPAVILNGVLGSGRVAPVESVPAADLPADSIVFVGALYERKGVDVLLHAMVRVREAVPTARLFLVGNRDNPELEQLAADLGLGDVATFVGFSPDPRSYMKAACVFVLPSRAEGFGNVLTEARSCATPIVATNVGGIPEALSGGRAGLLVDPGDADALAAAVVSVLTDPELAARLRAAASEDLEKWSVQRAMRQYDEVYATLRGAARR
jgi:glycosyltransferase involved in cell wall biosynthesis